MTPYPVDLSNIPLANGIVFSILLALFFVTLKKSQKKASIISLDDTQEIKGFAMLAIVAIHIGYSLVGNWEYLHPLSSFGGVGVDLFLILSGYGLTMSMMKHPLSPIDFYKKRLIKVFIPLWFAITFLFLMDWGILGIHYDIWTIIKSYLIYFPRADIWGDFNSPLWYMTWLAFFYILFPILFVKKYSWITPYLLALAGLAIVKLDPFDMQTNWLHGLHVFAFPLGALIASHTLNNVKYTNMWLQFREKYAHNYVSIFFYIIVFSVGYCIWKMDSTKLSTNLSFLSNFSDGRLMIEQAKSLLLALCTLLFFSFKPLKSQFLFLFGVFSYEIYLLHWPLMARYDILFHHVPAWLATLIWLGVLMGIGWGMQKIIQKLST